MKCNRETIRQFKYGIRLLGAKKTEQKSKRRSRKTRLDIYDVCMRALDEKGRISLTLWIKHLRHQIYTKIHDDSRARRNLIKLLKSGENENDSFSLSQEECRRLPYKQAYRRVSACNKIYIQTDTHTHVYFANKKILHETKSRQINDLKMNTYRLNNNND